MQSKNIQNSTLNISKQKLQKSFNNQNVQRKQSNIRPLFSNLKSFSYGVKFKSNHKALGSTTSLLEDEPPLNVARSRCSLM
ncbi:hypothetical protein LguiA_021781 [Lonicera macranthoides]